MRLIDADSLIGELHNTYLYDNDARSVIYRKIDEQPTVDAIPVRHGHWNGKPLAGYSTVKCSVCGSAFMENNGKWKYCPDCGALMDEVTE